MLWIIVGIYCIENIKTNKVYIGQSIDIETRIKRHFRELENGIHHSKHLQRSYDKYGKENFSWRVLEECLESDLDNAEIKWIKTLDSYKNGYNCTTGGTGVNGWKGDDAFKEKMSLIVMGEKNPNYGHKWSDKMKSSASKRVKESGKYRGSNNPRSRKIICIETLEIFDYIRLAAEKMNVGETSISVALNKKYRVASGYHFAYYTDEFYEYIKSNHHKYLRDCYSEAKNAKYYEDLTNKVFYTGKELFEKIHSESDLTTRKIKEMLNQKLFEINNVQYELLN